MWGKHIKIVVLLMAMCEVLTNGHQTAETNLLQVAFLNLKSIFEKDVLRECIEAQFVMCICLFSKLLGFVVEMLQGFTLKKVVTTSS